MRIMGANNLAEPPWHLREIATDLSKREISALAFTWFQIGKHTNACAHMHTNAHIRAHVYTHTHTLTHAQESLTMQR